MTGEPPIAGGNDVADRDDLVASIDPGRAEANRPRDFGGGRSDGGTASARDLQEVLRSQVERIAQLERRVGRQRRNTVITGALILMMLGIAEYFDVTRILGPRFWGSEIANHEPADRRPAPGLAAAANLIQAAEGEFEIHTDTDRKYQLIVRELYRRAWSIRWPEGPLQIRNAATDDYIQYIVDVSRVIEQIPQENVSPEISLALVHLATIGPEFRKVDDTRDLDVQTQNKLDQIESVLRARDARVTPTDRR